MSLHEFVIPVHDLDAAGKQFRFPVPAAWIRASLSDSNGLDDKGRAIEAPTPTVENDGVLDVRASKSGNDVVVHGSLKAEFSIPCGRCLKPAHVVVNEPISLLMSPREAIRGSKSEKDDYEFSLEEADVTPLDGDTAVLDDVVRDELVLQIPMIPLCSEDCPGILPPATELTSKSGEKAVDPRLLPLLSLKTNIKE